jgi:hypothetical protein
LIFSKPNAFAPIAKKEMKEQPVTPEIQKILDYKGGNTFVLDIKKKYETFKYLSLKQIEVTNKAITKEEEVKKHIKVNWKIVGETITIGLSASQRLKEKYNLSFNPRVLQVTRLLEVREKSIKVCAKLTMEYGSTCVVCNKSLTDPFSMATKMGKTCAKKVGVPYIKDLSETDTFKDNFRKRIEELGEMELFIPRSQIKKWEGKTSGMLLMI